MGHQSKVEPPPPESSSTVSRCLKMTGWIFAGILATLVALVVLAVILLRHTDLIYSDQSHFVATNNNNGTGSNFTEQGEPEFDFTGTFELVNSTNLDEFLAEVGVNYFFRQIAVRLSPEIEVTKVANQSRTYTVRSSSTFGEMVQTFQDGVPFERIRRFDGGLSRSVIHIKGNQWIQHHLTEPHITSVREFSPDYVVNTSTLNNITSVQVFKRLEKKSPQVIIVENIKLNDNNLTTSSNS